MAQTKENLKLETAAAVRTAIEKERTDCMAKLDHELRLVKQVVEDKNKEVEIYRMREAVLVEECQRYKNTIRRLTKSENAVRQTLNERVLYHMNNSLYLLHVIFVS